MRLTPLVAPEQKIPAPARIRVLAIDGGGIYGLATALWLRRLCERNGYFLDGHDVALFAGTSAGALNCLLLAKHERPREAVLSGDLERFWAHPGIFANHDPASAIPSLFGLTGWFSSGDFMMLLRRTFGGMKLRDLPHQVLLSTYNWTGAKIDSRAAQDQRHWRPKFFHNRLDDDPDSDALVVDVAYAAAAPPTLRPMFQGLGDGGTFSGNPALPALAHIKRYQRISVAIDDRQTPVLQIARNKAEEEHLTNDVYGVLDRVTVLSIGSGQKLPYLANGNVNAGLYFSKMPANVAAGDLWPTSAYGIDPANEEANHVLKQILGHDRALRLNPPVLDVPAVSASVMCRFPLWREWIMAQIRTNACGARSAKAVKNTLAFLESVYGWDAGRLAGFAAWTPPLVLADRSSTHASAVATMADGCVCMVWKGIETAREEREHIFAAGIGGTHSNVFVAFAASYHRSWEMQRKAKVYGRGDGTEILTDEAPALAYFGARGGTRREDGFLVMAWLAPDDASIRVSTGKVKPFPDGDADRNVEKVDWRRPHLWDGDEGGAKCAGAPALAARGDIVVLAWRSADGAVHVSKGTLGPGDRGFVTWEPSRRLAKGAPIHCPPAAAASPDEFVLVWSSDSGPGRIWIVRSKDGSTWTEPVEQELSASTRIVEADREAVAMPVGPALVWFRDRWCLAWSGPERAGNVWGAVSAPSDPLAWSPAARFRDRTSMSRPAFAIAGVAPKEKLLMAGRDPNLWFATLPYPHPEGH
jgi:hypothetical protein